MRRRQAQAQNEVDTCRGIGSGVWVMTEGRHRRWKDLRDKDGGAEGDLRGAGKERAGSEGGGGGCLCWGARTRVRVSAIAILVTICLRGCVALCWHHAETNRVCLFCVCMLVPLCVYVCVCMLLTNRVCVFCVCMLVQSWDGQDTILYTLPPCDQSPYWTTLKNHRIKVRCCPNLRCFRSWCFCCTFDINCSRHYMFSM